MSLALDIETLEGELRELQLPYFNAAIGWEIGSFIHRRSAEQNLSVAFEVSRPGQQLFYFAAQGMTPDNASWIRRKRNVVERFHKSSLAMRLTAEHENRPFLERYSLPSADYCSSGGGVPLMVRNSGFVGTVAITGLTQLQDHALAVEAIRFAMTTL